MKNGYYEDVVHQARVLLEVLRDFDKARFDDLPASAGLAFEGVMYAGYRLEEALMRPAQSEE